MKQEDKDLFLKDISARVFYNVLVSIPIPSNVMNKPSFNGPIELISINLIDGTCTVGNIYSQTTGLRMFDRFGELICKPYLRRMSSITEDELKELNNIDFGRSIFSSRHLTYHIDAIIVDYLNSHHLDYRGLIGRGLALEALEGMYKF